MNEVKKPVVPVIPREVAEAIEFLREREWSDGKLLDESRYNERHPQAGLVMRYLRENRVTFAAAIVNGYEIEKSAEEMAHDYIRFWYADLSKIASNPADSACQLAEARMWTIVDVLRTLGVKVEGVNA